MEERCQESPMELPQRNKEGEERKRGEKEESENFWRANNINSFDMTKSRHIKRSDSCSVTQSM
jgi:hypothetical protein